MKALEVFPASPLSVGPRSGYQTPTLQRFHGCFQATAGLSSRVSWPIRNIIVQKYACPNLLAVFAMLAFTVW